MRWAWVLVQAGLVFAMMITHTIIVNRKDEQIRVSENLILALSKVDICLLKRLDCRREHDDVRSAYAAWDKISQ